jgi:hypothetical protein
MEKLFQGVDEEDRQLGPLRQDQLSDNIHRRVALLVLDENNLILHQSGQVANEAVNYGQSSEGAVQEIMKTLGIQGNPLALGGIVQLRDQYSSLTHVFLLHWSGDVPHAGPWDKSPIPLQADGPLVDFINRALQPGRHRPLNIREDLRS